MTQGAGGDDYPSATLRLKLHVADLWELCESRLGLQQAVSENPNSLMILLNSVSEALGDISDHSPDRAVSRDARERQINFDEVADPLFQHMLHRYRDTQQFWETGAKYRSRLRRELSSLYEWSKEIAD